MFFASIVMLRLLSLGLLLLEPLRLLGLMCLRVRARRDVACCFVFLSPLFPVVHISPFLSLQTDTGSLRPHRHREPVVAWRNLLPMQQKDEMSALLSLSPFSRGRRPGTSAPFCRSMQEPGPDGRAAETAVREHWCQSLLFSWPALTR